MYIICILTTKFYVVFLHLYYTKWRVFNEKIQYYRTLYACISCFRGAIIYKYYYYNRVVCLSVVWVKKKNRFRVVLGPFPLSWRNEKHNIICGRSTFKLEGKRNVFGSKTGVICFCLKKYLSRTLTCVYLLLFDRDAPLYK